MFHCSAMPGFIGKRLCPALVFAKPDFKKYTAAAEKTRAIFADFDADFEAGSLDEAHLDVTDYCAKHGMTGEQVRLLQGSSFAATHTKKTQKYTICVILCVWGLVLHECSLPRAEHRFHDWLQPHDVRGL